MPRTRLNQKLFRKLAKKTRKPEKYIREQISKRASRQGISPEAVQILWAKEFGIGTTTFQRSLPPHVQEQVRETLPSVFATAAPATRVRGRGKAVARRKGSDPIRLAIEYLLADDELKNRCADLLKAKGRFDRVVREATTVLDDRLKRQGGIVRKMNPLDLVGKVLNPNPSKAILKLSDDPDIQEGFYSICKGLFLAFRNPAHHRLSDRFTRQDALRVCAFVDTLLAVLKQAQKNPAPT